MIKVVKNGQIYKINARPKQHQKHKIGAVTSGLTVVAKGTIVNYYCNPYFFDFYSCGADGYRQISTQKGQVLGITTGKSSGLFTTNIQLTLTTPFAGKNVGDVIEVSQSDVDLLAGNQATGAGFPISLGSKGSNVAQLQAYLNTKGASLLVDGIWGDKTQNAVLKYGVPTVINSKAQLDQITSVSASNLPTTTTPNLPTTTTPNLPTTPTPTNTLQNQLSDFASNPQNLLFAGLGGLVLLKYLKKGKKGKGKRKKSKGLLSSILG